MQAVLHCLAAPCNHITPRSAGFVCAAAHSQPCAPPRSADVTRLSHPHQPRDRPARHARNGASRSGCAPAASPPQTWRGTCPPAPDPPRFESHLAPAPSPTQPCQARPSTHESRASRKHVASSQVCTLLLDHMAVCVTTKGTWCNQVYHSMSSQGPNLLKVLKSQVQTRAPSYFGTSIGRPITVVMGTGCGSTPTCPNRPAGPRRAHKRRPPTARLHARGRQTICCCAHSTTGRTANLRHRPAAPRSRRPSL